MRTIIVHTDGGSRGNPGPAGIGVVIEFDANTEEISACIGIATNNQAEYQAVIHGLTWVKENIKDDMTVECLLDSQLVVEQLKGNYKMKNEGLKPLFWQIRELIIDLGGKVTFTHIPREENAEADRLVNKALDNDQMRGNK